MARAVFAIPGSIDTATGGYAYDRRVLELLPTYGVPATLLELPATFPAPGPAEVPRPDRWDAPPLRSTTRWAHDPEGQDRPHPTADGSC